MTDFIEPFIVEIGTVTLKEPVEIRESGANTPWFRDYVFAPGAYPLYAQVSGEQIALVTSPATAVVYSCDNSQEIGSSKIMRIPVFPKDILEERMSLDLMQAYQYAFEISDQNPYGVKTFVGVTDEPTWRYLVESAKKHYFMLDLFERNSNLRSYMRDNGFLESPKIDKGMLMGSSAYELVVRADRDFRKRVGHGFDYYSIPLHEIQERFETLSGSVRDMASQVAEQVVVDFDIPKKPGRMNKAGFDARYP